MVLGLRLKQTTYLAAAMRGRYMSSLLFPESQVRSRGFGRGGRRNRDHVDIGARSCDESSPSRLAQAFLLTPLPKAAARELAYGAMSA